MHKPWTSSWPRPATRPTLILRPALTPTTNPKPSPNPNHNPHHNQPSQRLLPHAQALDLFMGAPDHAAALQKLVGWVAEGNSNVTTPALRVLGNLCSGNAEHTQVRLRGLG